MASILIEGHSGGAIVTHVNKCSIGIIGTGHIAVGNRVDAVLVRLPVDAIGLAVLAGLATL